MRGEDVAEVMDALDAVGIRAWVDGGWAVDALLGEQTRPHADLDIAVPIADERRFRELAAKLGFVEIGAAPHNPVFRDERRRVLDVHFVDLGVVEPGPGGRPVHGGIAYEVGSFGGEGTILGRKVPCIGAEVLVRYHTGYEFDDDDVHDVLALCRRFGIPVPAEYARQG